MGDPTLTYRSSGVNIDAADELVERIKPIASKTHSPQVISGLGGFAGLFAMDRSIDEPVLVSGTDGVGTKLKLAFELDRHHSIGIDLVAMCVNDVLTVGAKPLFFLDYFATSHLDVDRAEQVIAGIAEGCQQAGCALLGGETAELPGFYAANEYDLAGFAVGVVSRKRMLSASQVQEGDVVLGVASSGLHSNGFSLARKALLETQGLSLHDTPVGLEQTLGECLLTPTRIYARAAQAALVDDNVHAFCHITGGGLTENLPRVLPRGLGVSLDAQRWPMPPVFSLLSESGVPPDEMLRTFNLGIGFIVVCAPDAADRIVASINETGEQAWTIGRVREEPQASPSQRVLVHGLPW